MKFFNKKPKQMTQKEAQIEVYELCTQIRKPKSVRDSHSTHERKLVELTEQLEPLIKEYKLLEYDKELKEDLLKPVYNVLKEYGLETYAEKLANKFDLELSEKL